MEFTDALAAAAVLISVAFGLWGVIVAHRANGRSRDANELAGEANAIAREALDMQKMTLPPAWGPIIELSPHLFGIENTSGRDIVVEKLLVEPDDATGMVRCKSGPPPQSVEYSDLLQLQINGAWQLSPSAITLIWHFEGDATEQRTSRGL